MSRLTKALGFLSLLALASLIGVVQTADAVGPGIWVTSKPMPTPRSEAGSAAIGNKAYVVGGAPSSSTTSDLLDEYDIEADSWLSLAPMPTPRHQLVAVAINGRLFAIGGCDAGCTTVYATLEEYDPSTNTWTSRPDMPTPRHAAAAAVANGKIYVMGGEDSVGVTLNVVEEYDPLSMTWATKAPMPTARHALAAAEIGGKIYAIGGAGPLSANEEYDPVLDAWTPRTPMLSPRQVLAAASLDGQIYAIGGDHGCCTPLSSNESYAPPPVDTWAVEPAMPTPRFYLMAVSLSGTISVLGGLQEVEIGVRLTTHETYCTDADGDGFVDCPSRKHEGFANTNSSADNCRMLANGSQSNTDGNFLELSPLYAPDDKTWVGSDAVGDACDTDDDNDGLSDIAEPAGCNSSGPLNPLLRDTDGDRFLDGAECVLGTNPSNAASKPSAAQCATQAGAPTTGTDTDLDRIKDHTEFCNYNSNPNDVDSDGDFGLDGAKDGCEAASLDADRKVSSGDQLLVVLEILRMPTPSLRIVEFDINKDGVVNAGDQLILAQIIATGECPQPPA